MRRLNCFTLVLLLILSLLLPVIQPAHATSAYTLAAPAIKSVTVSGTSVVVKWGAVKNAKQYEVYRSLNGAGSVSLGKVSGTSFTEKSVKPGAKYAYKVRALDGRITGKFSSAKQVTVPVPAPVLSSVAEKNGQVTITWKAVKGAANYELYRSVNGAAAVRLASPAGTSYTDKKVVMGNTYAYKVLAVAFAAKSPFSSAKSVKVPIPAPDLFSFRIFNSTALLTWTKVPGAESYQVYRSTDGSGYTLQRSTTGTQYSQDNLTPGTRYAYRVRAVVGKNTSANSNAGSAYVLENPLNVNVSLTGNTVTLKWDGIPNAEKYTVFVLDESSDKFGESISVEQHDSLGAQVVGYTGLPYGESTHFYIEARGKNTSARSWILTVYPLDPPRYLMAATKGDKVRHIWSVSKNNPEDTAYHLYVIDKPGFIKDELVLKPQDGKLQVSYTETIKVGEKRQYGIYANSDGHHSTTDITYYTRMEKPVITFFQQQDDKAVFSWNAVEGAVLYYATVHNADSGDILDTLFFNSEKLTGSVDLNRKHLGKNIMVRVTAVDQSLNVGSATSKAIYMLKNPSTKKWLISETTGNVILFWANVEGSVNQTIQRNGWYISKAGLEDNFGNSWTYVEGYLKPGKYTYIVRASGKDRGYQLFQFDVVVPEGTNPD